MFYESIADSLCIWFAQHGVGESNSCIRMFRRLEAFYFCIIFTYKDRSW